MSAPEYTEGEGVPNVTYTTHGPIIWYWNAAGGNWIEPRDMGWIPQVQAQVDERRAAERAATQADFDEWESELGQP